MPHAKGAPGIGVDCPTCGQIHTICTGHKTDTEASGLEIVRPCRRNPRKGITYCPTHGGGTERAHEAADRNAAVAEVERKARKALERDLGEAGERVTDPLGALLDIAGRLIRFMEIVGEFVTDLDGLEATEIGVDGFKRVVQPTIIVYQNAMAQAAKSLTDIVKLGIMDRIADTNGKILAAIVTMIDAILIDLGHNPADPAVQAKVVRNLRAIQGGKVA